MGLKDFKELSFEAWRYSEEVNKQNAKSAQQEAKGAALADDDVKTVHYWLYSLGENAHLWDECYKTGIMAIGWDGKAIQYLECEV